MERLSKRCGATEAPVPKGEAYSFAGDSVAHISVTEQTEERLGRKAMMYERTGQLTGTGPGGAYVERAWLDATQVRSTVHGRKGAGSRTRSEAGEHGQVAQDERVD